MQNLNAEEDDILDQTAAEAERSSESSPPPSVSSFADAANNSNKQDSSDDEEEEEEEEDDGMDFAQYQTALEHQQQQEQEELPPLDRFGLHKAVQAGDLDRVKQEVLRRGPEASRLARDAWQLTPIFTACVHLQLDPFLFLLPVHFGGEDQAVLLEGSPLIHVVLSMARITKQVPLAMLRAILDVDAMQILAEDEYMRSPLRLAIEYNLDEDFTNLLLDASVVGVPDTIKGFTCLHAAAAAVNGLALFKTLVQKFGDSDSLNMVENEYKRTALHLVCLYHGERGRSEVWGDFQAAGGLVDLVDDFGKRADEYILPTTSSAPRSRRGKTAIYSHAICAQHHTCLSKLTTQAPYGGSRSLLIPPENVNRLKMLLDGKFGALRALDEEHQVEHVTDYAPAEMADVTRIHEWAYLQRLRNKCDSLEEGRIGELDGDTGFTRQSFTAALHASGALLRSIDRIVRDEDVENAFCCVRPPGHHAGPHGMTERCNSHGFCLLNNVAIAASYAMHVYRDKIKRVAIIDFDVHHGNGTEACVEYLDPDNTRKMRTTLGVESAMQVTVEVPAFKPWLSERDRENVLFCSVHGYGNDFYPGTGKSSYERNVLNQGVSTGNRLEWRRAWAEEMLPKVREFAPDLILISAGFDAHAKDDINCGLCGALEQDYEWLTQKLVCLANESCEGRIVSALEGGYQLKGMVVSAFARSVVEHVNALARADPAVHLWPHWECKEKPLAVEEEEEGEDEEEQSPFKRARLEME